MLSSSLEQKNPGMARLEGLLSSVGGGGVEENDYYCNKRRGKTMERTALNVITLRDVITVK